MYWQCVQLFMVLLVSCELAGCGLTVPDIKERWDNTDIPEVESADPTKRAPKITGTAQIEFEIRKRIYCELADAVLYTNQYYVRERETENGKEIVRQLIPLDWEAQVALSLKVEESSSLNPGAALNTAWPTVISYPAKAITALGAVAATTSAQAFSLGFGGTLSSTASRIDTFNPSYPIAYLMRPPGDDVCLPRNDPFIQKSKTPATSSPFIIDSDLGIKDWLAGAMFSHNLIHSPGSDVPASKPPVSYQITFVIVSNGNVTPTWKLVRWSANAGSLPFISAGRTRTHDLIITIGPKGQAANQAHLAAQIGTAVGNSNRTNLSTTP